MSWDAYLTTKDIDGNPMPVQDWNYTHNCNGMISATLEGMELSDYWLKHMGPCWWDAIEGKTAKDADPVFERIITELETNRERYEAMNPDNGWGSYETLLPVLKEMQAVAKAHPSAAWRVSG